MEENAKESFDLKIFSPFRTFFDGKALSLTAVNKTGQFDILGGHANFLSLLEPCEVLVKTPERSLKFAIKSGLLHSRNDKVTIFLNI